MFRFFTTDWGDNARSWKFSSAKTFENVVTNYYNNEIYFLDADNCGEYTYIFGVSDGVTTRYFSLTHEWDISREPVFRVNNYYDVKEITKEEANIPGDRDWISTTQTSYPERKKWPPEKLENW